MKRTILSLLILHLMIFTVCGDDLNDEGSYVINLSCDIAPTYTVKIPKKIDVSGNRTIMTFYVRGDIYADQCLDVIFDRSTVISDRVSNIPISVEQDKQSWSYSELNDDYTSSQIILTHTTLKAGRWNGHLDVRISLRGAS